MNEENRTDWVGPMLMGTILALKGFGPLAAFFKGGDGEVDSVTSERLARLRGRIQGTRHGLSILVRAVSGLTEDKESPKPCTFAEVNFGGVTSRLFVVCKVCRICLLSAELKLRASKIVKMCEIFAVF